MDKEKLNELWETLSSATHINHLDYGTAVTIGSVFGQMKSEIERLQLKVRWLEMANAELNKHPNT